MVLFAVEERIKGCKQKIPGSGEVFVVGHLSAALRTVVLVPLVELGTVCIGFCIVGQLTIPGDLNLIAMKLFCWKIVCLTSKPSSSAY